MSDFKKSVDISKKYSNGALVVQFWSVKHKCWVTLSVNIPGVSEKLGPGYFCVKNWSENEEIAEIARTSGHFIEAGYTVPTGYVTAPIWKVNKP